MIYSQVSTPVQGTFAIAARALPNHLFRRDTPCNKLVCLIRRHYKREDIPESITEFVIISILHLPHAGG